MFARKGSHRQRHLAFHALARIGAGFAGVFAFAATCVGVITFTLLVCGMEGCNTTDSVVEEEPVVFRDAIPDNGSEIAPSMTVIARFDRSPTDLSVSGGTLSVRGVEATITGPFYIDIDEVTNADFQKFVLANPEWQKENVAKDNVFYLGLTHFLLKSP